MRILATLQEPDEGTIHLGPGRHPADRGLAFVIRRVRATGGDVNIETSNATRFRVRCSIPILPFFTGVW